MDKNNEKKIGKENNREKLIATYSDGLKKESAKLKAQRLLKENYTACRYLEDK